MEKALAKLDAAEVRARAGLGQALTLAELALVRGLAYTAVRALRRRDGFPMDGGRVFLTDFDLWRQAVVFRLPVGGPRSGGDRPESSAGKFGRRA